MVEPLRSTTKLDETRQLGLNSIEINHGKPASNLAKTLWTAFSKGQKPGTKSSNAFATINFLTEYISNNNIYYQDLEQIEPDHDWVYILSKNTIFYKTKEDCFAAFDRNNDLFDDVVRFAKASHSSYPYEIDPEKASRAQQVENLRIKDALFLTLDYIGHEVRKKINT